MDKAHAHPARDQRGLARGDCAQQGQVGLRLVGQARIVAGDRVVGQHPELFGRAAGGEELERAHAQVAGRHAGEHRAGQGASVAKHRFAAGHHRQCAGGGNAQRVHGLAHQVLAQYRAERGLAVAAARKRRAARTLERNVAPLAVYIDDLAQQQCPSVAQLGREAAELMPGVGLGDGRGAFGRLVA